MQYDFKNVHVLTCGKRFNFDPPFPGPDLPTFKGLSAIPGETVQPVALSLSGVTVFVISPAGLSSGGFVKSITLTDE